MGLFQKSLTGIKNFFLFRVPMNPQKDWKAKLERPYFFKVQLGKITVCFVLIQKLLISNAYSLLKYGFCKKLFHYECTSVQLTISSHQNQNGGTYNTLQHVLSNFLQNPQFTSDIWSYTSKGILIKKQKQTDCIL